MADRSVKNILHVLSAHWELILAMASACFAGFIAIRYAELPLLESYAFRQTQTALSAYWMMQEGWSLAYQTPVVGYPWSIPYEFPVYQALAALIAWCGKFNLDAVGRMLSFVFLLACAWPALNIAKRLNLPAGTAWVFCALLWTSPLYVFWGRTFMIETAAVFFTLAALPYALELCGPQPRWRAAGLCGVFFALGALQKVTTAAPVIVVTGLMTLHAHFKQSGLKLPAPRQFLYACLALLPPILAALAWTKYSDAVKSLNPIGQQLTSDALKGWNFGTLEQRLNPETYKTIFWDRVVSNNIAGIHGLGLIAAALFFGDRQLLKLMSVCLLLFVLPIAVFTNLHFIHAYYQISCVLFLIAALALACSLWLPQVFKLYAMVPLVTVLFVANNVYIFPKLYSDSLTQLNNEPYIEVLEIGKAIKRFTPLDSGIAVFGYDWSSEIAYYSERKALTVPNWFKDFNKAWQNPAAYLGDKKLGALVYCNLPDNVPLPPQRLEKNPKLLKIGHCQLWFPHMEASALEKILADAPRYPKQKTAGCGFNQVIDRVNGLPSLSSQKNTTKGLLSVSGWMTVDAGKGLTADAVYITLNDMQGNPQYYLTTRSSPRNDVKAFFNQAPSIADYGFSSTVDVSDIHGQFVLGLARAYQGELVRCMDYFVPIRF